MSRVRFPLNLETLVKAVMVGLLMVNIALFMGAFVLARNGSGQQEPASSESVATLRDQVVALQKEVQAVHGITAAQAEELALGYLQVIEQEKVEVTAYASTTRRERFGRQDRQVFVTNFELRGRRDLIVDLLTRVPELFHDNAVIGAVDARGPSDAWTVRFTLSQVIQ